MEETIKVQRLGENLAIVIPTEICEKLNLEEGSEINIEPFICSGESGARIKAKN